MASGTRLVVKVDMKKVRQAIQDGEGLHGAIAAETSRITANANSLSSGFFTGLFYDRSAGRMVGNTQARYAGDTAKKGRSTVGLVHPANYSAMKDNHQNNTLLKSLGR